MTNGPSTRLLLIVEDDEAFARTLQRSFARRGWSERSLMLRREGLRQASDGAFAEYYEPFSGEPLGSMQQSWTAAAVLDWLG